MWFCGYRFCGFVVIGFVVSVIPITLNFKSIIPNIVSSSSLFFERDAIFKWNRDKKSFLFL